MALTDRLMDALQTALVLNERVATLARQVERLDDDVRGIDHRLVRLETLASVSRNASSSSLPGTE